MAGTPAYIVETHDRLNADLIIGARCGNCIGHPALFLPVSHCLARLGHVAPGWRGIIAWGLAAYSLIRPELTLLAAAVPTLLIGIGIDHCIHMIQACRYSIDQDGLTREAAVMSAWWRLFLTNNGRQPYDHRHILRAGPRQAAGLCRFRFVRCAGIDRRVLLPA